MHINQFTVDKRLIGMYFKYPWGSLGFPGVPWGSLGLKDVPFIVCLSWLYFSDTCLCRSWNWRMRSVRSYWRSGTRWERSSRSSLQVCLRWGQYISRIRAILRWERSSKSSPQVCLRWGQHISRIRAILRWERSSRSSPQVCLRWGQHISKIRAILRWAMMVKVRALYRKVQAVLSKIKALLS